MLKRLTFVPVLALLLSLAACGGPPASPPRDVVGHVIMNEDFYGAATASLEERIYSADVVVRATLLSVEADGYRFQAVEYLKGTGPKSFTVQASTANRNARWDGREAVLFLSRAAGGQRNNARSNTPGAAFTFTDTTAIGDYIEPSYAQAYAGSLLTGDTIDRNNPVWLPAVETSGSSGRGSRSTDGTSNDYITDRSPGGRNDPTVSLADLRTKIAWIEGATDAGEEYRECIQASLNNIRYRRDWEAWYGAPQRKYPPLDYEIASGAAKGTVVVSSSFASTSKYHGAAFLDSPDASLFGIDYVDDDDDPGNGWSLAITTARPLPAAVYTATEQFQPARYFPCDFVSPTNQVPTEVTVTAPEGTVHEAFFDPATLSTGDGYDGTAGTLEPAGFSIDGTTTAITRLKWRDGSVLMSLAPYVSLSGHHLDFIALDGTLAHTVAVGDATRDGDTLSWPVDANPWPAGDQIMLRVYRKVVSTCTVPEGGMKPGACYEKPAFRSSSYAFTLAEDAKVSRNVGAVSATVSGAGRPSYSIAGDGADHFSITDRGAIRTAAQLDHETMPTYSLEVVASSGRWGRSTASVTVTVTDVDPEFAPYPWSFTVVEVDGGFDMSWDAVPEATKYAIQYKAPGVFETYVDILTTSTSNPLRLTGGARCNTEYLFRAFSHGDDDTYVSRWGHPSPVTSLTTAPCPGE